MKTPIELREARNKADTAIQVHYQHSLDLIRAKKAFNSHNWAIKLAELEKDKERAEEEIREYEKSRRTGLSVDW
jgi:hypothetical protein